MIGASLAAPWLAAPLTIALLLIGLYCHRHWLAIFPEDPIGTGRHAHERPTPMAGFVPGLVALLGIVLIPVLATTDLAASEIVQLDPGLFAGVAIAVCTGYLDDRGKSEGKGMRWQSKGIALLIAVGLASNVLRTEFDLSITETAIAIVWLFAVTNAVNFMDNTDGVATSLGGMGLLLVSGVDGPWAYLGCAYLGLVPLNWPKARVFLGDSGSLGLGLCLGFATFHAGFAATGQAVNLHGLAPLAIFAADFVQVIVARLLIGVPPWEGDRRHLTHVIANLGLPKLAIAPLFAGLGFGAFLLLRQLAK